MGLQQPEKFEDLLKKDYATLAEAWEALSPEERDHAERVGEYMQVLFLNACANEIYEDDPKAAVRLKPEKKDLVKEIGRLHDIGKILVPKPYHEWSDLFSPEESALYFKHAQDSAKLAEQFLKGEGTFAANDVKFLIAAIAGHHERWDGQGQPAGTEGRDIDLFARMLTVADALDKLSVTIRSETPLEDALVKLDEGTGNRFDPTIMKLAKSSRAKLKKIFMAHVSETKAITVAECVIKRSPNRPFNLKYRPVALRKNGNPVAYECLMSFKDKEGEQRYADVEYIFKKEKRVDSLGLYFIREACDTLVRLDNCSIPCEYMILDLPTGWLNRRGAWKDIEAAAKAVGLEAGRLVVNVTAERFATRNKFFMENLDKFRQAGGGVMYTGILPEELSEEDKLANYYRLTGEQESYLDVESTPATMKALREQGITLLSDGIDKVRRQSQLTGLGILCRTGVQNGDYLEEDELVRRELAASALS